MFEYGLQWVKTDFHLHTHKDKEFKFSGGDNAFPKAFIRQLKSEYVSIGVITNYNKFNLINDIFINDCPRTHYLKLSTRLQPAKKRSAWRKNVLLAQMPNHLPTVEYWGVLLPLQHEVRFPE